MKILGLIGAFGRLLVGWFFVYAGQRVLRHPAKAAALSAPTLAAIRTWVTLLPADDALIVRGNAAMHVSLGALFATGRAPRLTATLLAMSLVPTTVAGHRFWAIRDPADRHQQRTHFDKNLAIAGALLIAATAPRPSSAPPEATHADPP